ncbi:MAG TPA: helix-turn-helix domain-containing protein [Streptosporangiaceae bacterium]|nr:helix-turn-helix domain-containing protein [Streptosporangiaceae bacterium]
MVPIKGLHQLLPELDRLAEEMVEAIQGGIPEYARPLNHTYNASIRQAVTHAVHDFVHRAADAAAPRDRTAQLFRGIGSTEAAEGRSLEPLQTALRLGARVAWHTLGQQAAGAAMDSRVLAAVGEAIFLYLDEIAAACAAGFAEATAEAVGELQRRRSRLIDLIVVDPPASHDAIADLAQAARWPLPGHLAALALEPRGPGDLGPVPALPPDVLIDLTRADPCALVPDPDGPGRAQAVERGLRGWTAAVGPTTTLARAGSSLRWARHALTLARPRTGSAPPGHVIKCAEHLSSLLILADEELARTLAAVRLHPLRTLRPAQQQTLAQTLLCWLQSGGNAREVARRLHVHPQTARYRLRQLRLLFGEELEKPDARFELEIALRAEGLLGAEGALR